MAASLSTTYGRPVRRCFRYGASWVVTSSASTPVTTSMPASRRRAMPWPVTFGSGSSMPTTTRATPASTMASTHGPVRPVCEQGSSVVARVAPRAAAPAASRATISAWRPPGGSVAPANSVPSAVRTTAPTQGFGEVDVRTDAARWMAPAMSSRSPVLGCAMRSPVRDRAREAPTAPRSHPDSHRRPRSSTGSAPTGVGVRGLSPPVGTCTRPREGVFTRHRTPPGWPFVNRS